MTMIAFQTVFFLACVLLLSVANAQTITNETVPDKLLRFILNNNVVAPGMTCRAPADRAILDEVFEKPDSRKVRHLRQVPRINRVKREGNQVHFLDEPKDYIDISGVNNNHRSMQQSASYCRNNCGGYVPGSCHVAGCAWFNKGRRRELGKNSTYGLGVLSSSTWCTETAEYLNNELDYIIDQNLVSEACQTLLDMPRVIQCFSETVYGLVETFNLYNADTDLIIKNAMGAGYKICSGTAINFLVKANACVKNLKVTVSSTDGTYHRESYGEVLPVTLFPKDGTDFQGEILPDGNYIISGVPDGDLKKLRSRRFIVAPC